MNGVQVLKDGEHTGAKSRAFCSRSGVEGIKPLPLRDTRKEQIWIVFGGVLE